MTPVKPTSSSVLSERRPPPPHPQRTRVPLRDANLCQSLFCLPLPPSSACPIPNWCGVAILTASQWVLWHLLFGLQPRLWQADDNMKLWPFVLWRIMFSSARCCGDKLENFFFQKLKKQIKGPLYFAFILQLEMKLFLWRGRRRWGVAGLWRLWSGNEGTVDFSCSPHSLTDRNLEAHTHTSLVEKLKNSHSGRDQRSSWPQVLHDCGQCQILRKRTKTRNVQWSRRPPKPPSPWHSAAWGSICTSSSWRPAEGNASTVWRYRSWHGVPAGYLHDCVSSSQQEECAPGC